MYQNSMGFYFSLEFGKISEELYTIPLNLLDQKIDSILSG